MVCIPLCSVYISTISTRSIDEYSPSEGGGNFEAGALFKSIGSFIGIFVGSFILGTAMGLVTALVYIILAEC